jgi:hypothetical protein
MLEAVSGTGVFAACALSGLHCSCSSLHSQPMSACDSDKR